MAAVAAGGCLHDDGTAGDFKMRVELERQRQQWAAMGTVSYDYYFKRTCFCPETGEVLIAVRDGAIERITYVDSGEDVPADRHGQFMTVPGLFDAIEQAIDGRADLIQAEYDASLGYPTFVYVDWISGLADDEMQLNARDLNAM